MELSEAVSQRLIQLLNKHDYNVYEFSGICGVASSTLDNIIHAICHSCNLTSINNICRGFKISLKDFFDSDIFEPENIDDN